MHDNRMEHALGKLNVITHHRHLSSASLQTIADGLRFEIYYVYLEITTKETHEFIGKLNRFRI